MMSVGPPGGKGTTIRTGRAGKSCAAAGAAKAERASTARRRTGTMALPPRGAP
jgi:hypothetical protein